MKRFLALVLMGVMVFGLAACGGSGGGSGSGSAAADSYTFRMGNCMEETHPYTLSSNHFAELMAEKTDGKVEVKVFPNSALGNDNEIIEALRAGTVDFYTGATASIAGFTQHCYVLDLPFLFKNNAHVDAVLDGEIGEELLAGFEDIGVIGLAWWENGFRCLANNVRPVKGPEDVKGLKVRTPEIPVLMNTFETLGAIVTPMTYSEVYMALQQGVVDGHENPVSSIHAGKMYEVQKYFSLTRHMYSAAEFIMSKKTWDTLPADLQATIREAGKETAPFARQTIRDQDENLVPDLEAGGMALEMNVDREAFVAATQPVYDKWAPQMGDLIDRIRALEPA